MSDMYYSVGSVTIENTTSGFDFSEDNPGSILLPLGYYNPVFSTAGRVRYSNKDKIICGGICVSASIKRNTWGPVPIIFITREFYSPKTPNGMAEFINDETVSYTVASTDMTLRGMKLLSDNTPIHLNILSANAVPADSVDEPSAGK